MTEKEMYLWLASSNMLEIGDKNKLIQFFGSPQAVWEEKADNFEKAGFPLKIAEAVKNSKIKYNPDKIYNEMYRHGIKFTAICDNIYPERLKNIDVPPLGLFYKGSLPENELPSVAVIGARLCSDYGTAITNLLVKELVNYGIQIISGLAIGIDGHAHKAALDYGGKTFGILGTGADIVYPKENYLLFSKMYERGGVITEYYIGTKGLKHHFPERNRIISGFADCLLVVEAKKKSGTMITTDKALEQGKDVFVVPGRIGDILSEGCLMLAKQGAALAVSAEDVLFSLKDKYSGLNTNLKEKINYKNVKFSEYDKNRLENNEIIVYALLSFKAKHFEEIMLESSLDYFTLFSTLNGLCEKGLAIETEPGCYALGTNAYLH